MDPKILDEFKELFGLFDRSMLVQNIWPEAFDFEGDGKVKAQIIAGAISDKKDLLKIKIRYYNPVAEKTFMLSELPEMLQREFVEQIYVAHRNAGKTIYGIGFIVSAKETGRYR